MSNDAYCFVDLETTGVDPRHDSIIEIGLLVTDINLTIHRRFSTLVVPDSREKFAVDDEGAGQWVAGAADAERIHSITPKAIYDNGIPENLARSAVSHLLYGYSRVTLVSDNPAFEYAFLNAWYEGDDAHPFPFHYCPIGTGAGALAGLKKQHRQHRAYDDVMLTYVEALSLAEALDPGRGFALLSEVQLNRQNLSRYLARQK